MAAKSFNVRLFVSGETIEVRRDAESRVFLRLTTARSPGCCLSSWSVLCS